MFSVALRLATCRLRPRDPVNVTSSHQIEGCLIPDASHSDLRRRTQHPNICVLAEGGYRLDLHLAWHDVALKLCPGGHEGVISYAWTTPMGNGGCKILDVDIRTFFPTLSHFGAGMRHDIYHLPRRKPPAKICLPHWRSPVRGMTLYIPTITPFGTRCWEKRCPLIAYASRLRNLKGTAILIERVSGGASFPGATKGSKVPLSQAASCRTLDFSLVVVTVKTSRAT